MSDDYSLYSREVDRDFIDQKNSPPRDNSDLDMFDMPMGSPTGGIMGIINEIEEQKENNKQVKTSKTKIMKYNTSVGKITATEMDDRHLENRLRFEINKLNEAKKVLSMEEEAQTSKWQELQNKKSNKMTETRACDVLELSDAVIAPLVLECVIRGIDVVEYGQGLNLILDRKKPSLPEDDQLFPALPAPRGKL